MWMRCYLDSQGGSYGTRVDALKDAPCVHLRQLVCGACKAAPAALPVFVQVAHLLHPTERQQSRAAFKLHSNE